MIDLTQHLTAQKMLSPLGRWVYKAMLQLPKDAPMALLAGYLDRQAVDYDRMRTALKAKLERARSPAAKTSIGQEMANLRRYAISWRRAARFVGMFSGDPKELERWRKSHHTHRKMAFVGPDAGPCFVGAWIEAGHSSEDLSLKPRALRSVKGLDSEMTAIKKGRDVFATLGTWPLYELRDALRREEIVGYLVYLGIGHVGQGGSVVIDDRDYQRAAAYVASFPQRSMSSLDKIIAVIEASGIPYVVRHPSLTAKDEAPRRAGRPRTREVTASQ